MTKTTTPPAQDQPPQQQNSWLAISSLILGIMGLTGFGMLAGVPAIITGAMALSKKQGDRGMSIAGIIMGAISTLLTLLLILFFMVLIIVGIDAAGNVPEFNPNMMPNPQEWIESSQI